MDRTDNAAVQPLAIKDSESGGASRRGGSVLVPKVLVVLVVVLLVLVVGLVVALGIVGSRLKGGTTKDDVCMTSACLAIAASVKELMDHTKDPCEDFFSYACGGWLQKDLPADKGRWSAFDVLIEDNRKQIREILEERSGPDEPEAVTKAKVLYSSCMNEAAIEHNGDQPLLDMISEMNGWPVVDDNWSDADWTLQDTMVKIQVYGKMPLFKMMVLYDDKNPDVNILRIDEPRLGLSSGDYYLSNQTNYVTARAAYYDYMVSLVLLLRNDDQRDVVEQQMKDVLAFETELAKITSPVRIDPADPETTYNRLVVANLPGLTPQFSWLRYLNSVLGGLIGDPIREDESVLANNPQYLEKLGPVLNSANKRTLANFLVWRAVAPMVWTLSKDYRKLRDKLVLVTAGTEPQPRWEKCVAVVNNWDTMGFAVGNPYVKKYFRGKSKEMALEMINDLRGAFSELLHENTWMDQATRTVAEEKVNTIRNFIGYPEYLLNDVEKLNENYNTLKFEANNLFRNVLTLNRWHFNDTTKVLRDPFDRDKFIAPPAMVNAFYHAVANSIVFPAAILVQPLFSTTQPKYLNYGGIGAIIGHEITHGFDNTGRKYNKDGKYVEWWSQVASERFQDKARCVREQYSTFVVPETEELKLKIDGNLTLGENIADIAGLSQTLRAYRNFVRKNGPELILPGIDLNQEQLLFLSHGQSYCSKLQKKYAALLVHLDPHSPMRFRVNGPVMNNPDFAKLFSCPAGSPMNPHQRCDVW